MTDAGGPGVPGGRCPGFSDASRGRDEDGEFHLTRRLVGSPPKPCVAAVLSAGR